MRYIYKERPKYRTSILRILKEVPTAKLEDIANGFYMDKGKRVLLLGKAEVQAKKMLDEKKGLWEI